MNLASQWLLIGAVGAVGILHTMVPDHWLPIVVMARQQQWSKSETARAAFQAGTGHVLSTLAIAVLVWITGAVAARRFAGVVDTASSIALIGFGLWVAVSAWREQHHLSNPHHHHPEAESHAHSHSDATSTHAHEKGSRTALILILGSSPMVEGIPAFFAATKYGVTLVVVMAVVFAASTITTYVLLCTLSTAGLQHVRLRALERYGEVLSGLAIAVIGIAFWLWSAR